MEKIAVITVTYNPNINQLIDNINSYIDQASIIIVVDNSDIKGKQQSVKNVLGNISNVLIISLEDNYGIAYAQNIGIKYAIDKGYRYFIEIDQDSSLPINYINDIYKSYMILKKNGVKVAGIGSLSINNKTGEVYSFNENNNNDNVLIEVSKTLSSGFLTPINSLETVGFKKEDLFIDYVDWEWNWRARQYGLKTFINKKVKINHMKGEGYKKILLWKVGVPSPIRHYYQYRNGLVLLKLKYVPLNWKIKRVVIHILKILIILFFMDKKKQRIAYAFCGIKDYFNGILGKYKCAE